MLYAGKRLTELDDDELQTATAYCLAHRDHAEAVYSLNVAALQELAAEMARRSGSSGQTIN